MRCVSMLTCFLTGSSALVMPSLKLSPSVSSGGVARVQPMVRALRPLLTATIGLPPTPPLTIGLPPTPPPPIDFDDNWSDDGDGERVSLATLLAVCWQAYMNVLERHPVFAKAVTAAAVGGIGDAVAQRLTQPTSAWDHERFLAVCFDGLLISGPFLHLGYGWLERRWPCSRGGQLRHVGLQLLIDECVFDPLFIGAFFFSTGAVERQYPILDTLPTLRRQYWSTLRGAFATSLAFTPIQFVSFRYLPVQTRVLVVNVCDVLWYAAVSLGRHVERAQR